MMTTDEIERLSKTLLDFKPQSSDLTNAFLCTIAQALLQLVLRLDAERDRHS